MIHLVFAGIAIFVNLIIFLYLNEIGIVDIKYIERINKKDKRYCRDIIPIHGIKLYFLMIIIVFVLYFSQIKIYENTLMTDYIKFIFLLFILIPMAIIDLKINMIPNQLIIIGLFFRMVMYIVEINAADNFNDIIISDLSGFGIGFGVLAVVSIVTRQALGAGDVKMFGVIGLLSGAVCTYTTLVFSVFIAAIVSIVLLITRKKGKKDTIPFGPCTLIGYIAVVLLGSY